MSLNKRIKDLPNSTTSPPSDAFIAVDSNSEGPQKLGYGNAAADIASKYVAAPGTYKVCPLDSDDLVDPQYLPPYEGTPASGTWAIDNTDPVLNDGTGTEGQNYFIESDGTVSQGAGTLSLLNGTAVSTNGKIYYNSDGKWFYAPNSREGELSITQYGASTAASDNRSAIQSAITDAVATGKTLRIPAGTFNVTLDATNTKLNVTGDLKLVGEGKGVSILKLGPSPVTFAYNGLEIDASKIVDISDLTIEGPADPGVTAPTAVTHSTRAIEVNSATAGTGRTTLTRVSVTGKCDYALQVDTGVSGVNHDIVLTDCDLKSYGVVCAVFHEPNGDNTRRLSATRCHFHGNEVTQAHLCYIHPHIPFEFVSCRFSDGDGGGTKYAVHVFGSGNTVPDYQRMVDCFIDDTWEGNGILTSGSNSRIMEVRGLTWKGPTSTGFNGIAFRGSLTVSDSQFYPQHSTSEAIVASTVGGDEDVRIFNSRFDLDTNGSGITFGNIRSAVISGCEFYKSGGNGTAVQILYDFDPVVSNCRFVNTGINMYSSASLTVCDSYFTGNGGVNGCIANISPSTPGLLRVIDTYFNSTNKPVWVKDNSAHKNKIIWQNNTNEGTGDCQFNGTTVAASQSQARLPKGLDPTSIASAATLVITSENYDAWHVTGTTNIDDIHFHSSSDFRYTHFWGGATITLIFDGILTLSNSAGNIRTNTAANYTTFAGETLTFIIDASGASPIFRMVK